MHATSARPAPQASGSCFWIPTASRPQICSIRYFAAGVASDVGALAGAVEPAPPIGAGSLAARYAAARSFLSLEAHLAHPYLPRAVAANLIVRRSAFEQLGGFYEGVRAAEDTDFTWRLQQAGWRLEPRTEARVEHRYRTSLRDLRRQWRGYAAGRAWLGRRYEGFAPQPAVKRVLRRRGRGPTAPGPSAPPRRGEDRRHLALDALLGLEELAGLAMSNRPAAHDAGGSSKVVLVAERFPEPGDPLVDFARTLAGARVEAAGRPGVVDRGAAHSLVVSYREDDGLAIRSVALLRLAARHPLRSLTDVRARRPGEPPLSALAPAALRLERDSGAHLRALGGARTQATARRLAGLTGRRLES